MSAPFHRSPKKYNNPLFKRDSNSRRASDRCDAGYSHLPILSTISYENLKSIPDDNGDHLLGRPCKIGYYSIAVDAETGEQTYCADKSQLRYLEKPKAPIELLKGYNIDKKWPRSPVDHFHLQWILDNKDDLEDDDDKEEDSVLTSFITHSRILVTIMCAHSEKSRDWAAVAVKIRGSIILREVDTIKSANDAVFSYDYANAASYSGYKFEESATRRFDDIHRPFIAGGKRDSFYCLIKTVVNQHSLIFSSRMDCVKDKEQFNKPINAMEFVDIKTVPPFAHRPDTCEKFWNNRVLQIWSRLVLSGIDTLFWGHRTKNFTIDKMEYKRIKDLHHSDLTWSPTETINILDKTLSFIKSNVTEESVPYRFYFSPDSKEIICQRLDESVEKYVPSWYIDEQFPADYQQN